MIKHVVDAFYEKIGMAFRQISDFPLKMTRDGGDSCLRMPFSDKRFCYEFVECGNFLHVSIHLASDDCALRKDIVSRLKENQSFLQKGIPYVLNFGESSWDSAPFPCIYFSLPLQRDIDSIQFYAKMMKVLVSRSLIIFCQVPNVLNGPLSQYCVNSEAAAF